MIAPPHSEAQLLARSSALAGLSIAELAAQLGVRVPAQSTRAKGFVGQLVEQALGADAGAMSEPDFRHIGVELKTIPVSAQGKPFESTWVCVAELEHEQHPIWQDSAVWHKLARVLWMPVITAPGMAVAERRLGSAVLWSPSAREAAALHRDWQELMDLIVLGEVEHIDAYHGECLQIRPKAADSRSRRWGINEQGVRIKTLPRGFYLRPAFTGAVLQRCYAGLAG